MPSKSIGIYAVFIMLQDVVSICEKDKNTVFTMFLLPERGEIAKKNVTGFRAYARQPARFPLEGKGS